MDSCRPFVIDVKPDLIEDLKRRLAATRWPISLTPESWDTGVPIEYLRELCRYWVDEFDWFAHQRRLNEHEHYQVSIGDDVVHFIHAPGRGPNPLPLILTHGWPSSFFEFTKLLPLLTDPVAHGGNAMDAFDVVVPAHPGFPFSATQIGKPVQVPVLWHRLMTKVLGYDKFGAAGGDIGALVTAGIGRQFPEDVVGIHVQAVVSTASANDPDLTDGERRFLVEREQWAREEGGYSHQQQSRPQTLAYGLSDSPVGLAAWIVEKFSAWSDCDGDPEMSFTKDELLITPTLYWAANSIATSFLPYYRAGDIVRPDRWPRIDSPTAVALFPADRPVPPRAFAERSYNVQRWTEMPHGGHFAALEEPELLAEDLRAFFRGLR